MQLLEGAKCFQIRKMGMRLSAHGAAVTAIATVTTISAVAAITALFARTRFIYLQGASVQTEAFQTTKRRLGFRLVAHLNETEAARPVRLAIHNDARRVHLPVLFECRPEIILRGVVRQITNKDIHSDLYSFSETAPTHLKTALNSGSGQYGTKAAGNYTRKLRTHWHDATKLFPRAHAPA
jgi:hypothetical protein